jgi:hypothetical protein
VTDVGSAVLSPHDVLPRSPKEAKKRQTEVNPRCHFCAATVIYLRHDFVRYGTDKNLSQKSAFWPLGP